MTTFGAWIVATVAIICQALIAAAITAGGDRNAFCGYLAICALLWATVAAVARAKNRRVSTWLIWTFFFGVFPLLILIFKQSRGNDTRGRNLSIIVGAFFLVGFFSLIIVVGKNAENSDREQSYMTRPGGTFTPEPADTPNATSEPQTPSAFGDGQVAEIGAGGIGLPCFATKEDLDAFIDAETKHDSYGAGEALTNAVTLHRGEHVRAISHAGLLWSIIQIRIESGDDEDTACWLPSDAAGLFVNIRDD